MEDSNWLKELSYKFSNEFGLMFLYVLIALFATTATSILFVSEQTAHAQSFLFPPIQGNGANNGNELSSHTVRTYESSLNNEPLLEYQNSIYNLTIQYPSNWQKMQPNNTNINSSKSADEIVSFVPPPPRPSLQTQTIRTGTGDIRNNNTAADNPNQITEGLSIRVEPIQYTNTSIKQLIDNTIDSFKTSLPNFQLTDRVPITVNNGSFPAERIVYTYNVPSVNGTIPVKVMDVGTLKDNIVYVISYTTKPINYLGYLPTIQKMIDSFSIHDKSSTLAKAQVSMSEPRAAAAPLSTTTLPSAAVAESGPSTAPAANSPAPALQQHSSGHHHQHSGHSNGGNSDSSNGGNSGSSGGGNSDSSNGGNSGSSGGGNSDSSNGGGSGPTDNGDCNCGPAGPAP